MSDSNSNLNSSTSVLCLACAFVALAFGFVPMKSQQTLKHSYSLHCNYYRDALLISIGISSSVVVDLAMATYDFISSNMTRKDLFCHCVRIILFLCLFIPNLVCFSVTDTLEDPFFDTAFNGGPRKLFSCVSAFKMVTSVCCVAAILCQKSCLNAKRWNLTGWAKIQSCFLVSMAIVFQAFSVAAEETPSHRKSYQSLANSLYVVMVAQVFVLTATYMYNWFFKDWKQALFIDDNDKIIACTCLLLLCIRCIALLILIQVSSLSNKGYSFISERTAAADLYVQMIFMVGCVVVPWHVTKSNTLTKTQVSLDEKTSFMRFISHEVRAPLNVAGLSLIFLKSEAKALESAVSRSQLSPIMDAVVDVERSCKAAVSILNDVLLLDKMTGGKMELEMRKHHPVALFREFYRQFGIVAKQNKVNFVFECKGEEDGWTEEHSISIDAVRFGQVLRNLLTNAFKFTPAAGTVTIQVSCVDVLNDETPQATSGWSWGRWWWKRRTGGRESNIVVPDEQSTRCKKMLHVEVIDSGAGISKENQKKLFGQYVQFNANSLQKGGGSGLGLWISKGIMSSHGGKLWAESEGEGLGSRFIVEIPLVVGHVSSRRMDDFEMDMDLDLLASAHNSSDGPRGSKEFLSSRRFGVQCSRDSLGSIDAEIDLLRRNLAGVSGNRTSFGNFMADFNSDPPESRRIPMQLDLEAQLHVPVSTPKQQSFLSPVIECVGGEDLVSPENEKDQEADPRDERNRNASLIVPEQSIAGVGGSVGTGLKSPDVPSAWSSLLEAFGPAMLPVQSLIASLSGSADGKGGATAEKVSGGNAPSSSGSSSGSGKEPLPLSHGAATRSNLQTPSFNASTEENQLLGARIHIGVTGTAIATPAEHTASFPVVDVLAVDTSELLSTEPAAVAAAARGMAAAAAAAELASVLLAPSAALTANDNLTGNASGKVAVGAAAAAAAAAPIASQAPAVASLAPKELSQTPAAGALAQAPTPGILPRLSHSIQKLKKKTANGTPAQSLRILVVDDSAATRKVMGRLLDIEGHEVAFAVDGVDFLQAMRRPGLVGSAQAFAQFDVVLIDRHMPKLEGPEATRIIRDRGYKGLIVGLMADTGKADMAHFMDHGADAVLPKPFIIGDLDGIVSNFAKFAKLRKEKAEKERLQADRLKRPAASTPGTTPTLRILVVDDSSSTRKVMGRVLTKKGHAVSFAEDGEEFLKVMENSPANAFDVVLIDRHMPKLDGPDATRSIRAKGYKGFIVGLTGDTGEEDVKYFMDHGADSVLPKPFNIGGLETLVSKFIQRSKDGKESNDAVTGLAELRILVVDDSSSTRKVMGRVLIKKGHTVAFAEDGEEFMKAIQYTGGDTRDASGKASGGTTPSAPAFVQFDVVLIDRHMPKLDGPDATKLARAKGYKGLIVGLTGDTGEEDVKYFKDHGADAVLPKPFNVDALNSIISAFRARDQVVKFEMPVHALMLQSLHVLVADNLTSSRKVVGRMLTKNRHTVVFAVDGEELFKSIAPENELCTFAAFDVVLLDRFTPKVEGPEATRRLREKGYTGLIVGLVGDAGPESRDRLLFQEQGADAVLPKPFNITALDDIVRQYVDRKR